MSLSYRGIITLEAGKRSGKPCIRGLKIANRWFGDACSTRVEISDGPGPNKRRGGGV